MRTLLILALLVGCGGGKAKQEPLSGTHEPTEPKTAPKGTQFHVEMAPAAGFAMEATIRVRKTGEPLIGATVVLVSPALVGEQVSITDDEGRVAFADLPPGDYTANIYYDDTTSSGTFKVEKGKVSKVRVEWEAAPAEVVTIQAVEEPKFKTSMEALGRGALGQAVRLGQDELKKKPTAQLHGAMAIARYGFAVEVLRVDAFAFGGQKKTSKDLTNALAAYLGEMDKIQDHLAAAAKDGKFALELCVACMAADDGFFMLAAPGFLDVERDKQGRELPGDDKRRKPTYRFDHGDLAWGRAFVHFNQAAGNIVLAYDWTWLDKYMSDDQPDEPVSTKITIKLADPARIAKAKEHILAGLQASDEARLAYLSETDDDREWVPSPKQKSYASPLAVDDKLYNTWKQVVEDVRVLVAGKTGISLKALWAVFGSKKVDAPAGFIDIAAMLNKPTDIVLELGVIDRIEAEKNRAKRAKLTQTLLEGILGNGMSTAKMKPSPLTDRVLQLRKDADGAEQAFEDKMKYLLWLN